MSNRSEDCTEDESEISKESEDDHSEVSDNDYRDEVQTIYVGVDGTMQYMKNQDALQKLYRHNMYFDSITLWKEESIDRATMVIIRFDDECKMRYQVCNKFLPIVSGPFQAFKVYQFGDGKERWIDLTWQELERCCKFYVEKCMRNGNVSVSLGDFVCPESG